MHACRLPFWAYMKLLFCMWLVLPMFHGAAYIYEKHIRRYVKIGGYVSPSSNYTADQRKVLQMMSLDARKSVSQYVEKHGWETVERAIKAVINYWIKKLNTFICSCSSYICFVLFLQAEKETKKRWGAPTTSSDQSRILFNYNSYVKCKDGRMPRARAYIPIN